MKTITENEARKHELEQHLDEKSQAPDLWHVWGVDGYTHRTEINRVTDAARAYAEWASARIAKLEKELEYMTAANEVKAATIRELRGFTGGTW